MVVMILQLSCLTHAESILGIWLKANALGPLGDRLSCLSLSTTCDSPRFKYKPKSGKQFKMQTSIQTQVKLPEHTPN